jgi:Anti-sigma-28 factor, FlgM
LPEIRHEKVDEIRRQIAAGSYETPEKMELALDRMLDELMGWYDRRSPRMGRDDPWTKMGRHGGSDHCSPMPAVLHFGHDQPKNGGRAGKSLATARN